jgi:mannosyltransferase OCH1-like enzyme
MAQKVNHLLLVPILPFRPGIPKIVHQIYRDWESVPHEIKDNIERMKRENPAWEFRFYSHEDSIRLVKDLYGKRILTYFLRLREEYGPARADLFRYLVVYALGGVYMDLKSTLIRPLDEVLRTDDTYILSQWRNRQGEKEQGAGVIPPLFHIPGGEYQQWHVIAARGHPYLRAVIAQVLSNIDHYNPELNGVGKVGVLIATGPVPYTLTIHPIKEQFPHRVVQVSEDLGLEFSLYDQILANGTKLTMAHETRLPSAAGHYSKLTLALVRPQEEALAEISQRFPKLK